MEWSEKERRERQKQQKHEKVLGSDSPLMYYLTKIGQIIMLNIVWLISCLPVITIGTATTSLYYAMMKNIRRNRSYPIKEYWASFKRTLISGSILTGGLAVWLFVLWYLRRVAILQETQSGNLMATMYVTLMVVTGALAIYLFPVLSRFTMKLSGMVKLAFVMMIRYFVFTLLILIGTALLVWVWYFYLPLTTILFWPGFWCFVCTFMVEKALRKYMPAPDENADAWYYE